MTNMRVNLGCGMHKAEGWYNVDIWSACDPDMVDDAVTLALPAGSVHHIYLGHLLEYMDIPRAQECMYNVWRMIKPGGWVCAVGIDRDRVNRLVDPDLWEMLHRGNNEDRTDAFSYPKWECTERELVSLMQIYFPNAQPVDLRTVSPQFPLVSRVHWQCAVKARKPVW